MDAEQSLAAICSYLKRQHVLTLCVGDAASLWCASCFYVFDPTSMAFFLMSGIETRHGELMQRFPQVAGTVAGQPKQVARIIGIQFSGDILLLSGEAEQAARARYLRRFPVARAMVAPIWQLRLRQLKMTDNRLGFGKKLNWYRDPAPSTGQV